MIKIGYSRVSFHSNELEEDEKLKKKNLIQQHCLMENVSSDESRLIKILNFEIIPVDHGGR